MSIFTSFVSGGSNAAAPDSDYATLMGTAMESLNVANSAMQELDVNERKFEQINKLADIMDAIPSASMEHLALIENSMESLIADSGVEVEDVLGVSLESVEGTQVSTERLRQMAKSAWEWIKTQLKKIRKAISDFFHSLFGATTRLRRAANSLIKRAQSMGGKSCSEAKLDITGEASVIADEEGKLVTKATDLIKYHGDWTTMLAAMNLNYFKTLKKVGDDLRSAIDKFDTEKPEESLSAVNAAVTGSGALAEFEEAFGSKAKVVTIHNTINRWPNKTVKGYALLGSQIIVHVAPSTAGTGPTALAEQNRGTQFVVSSVKAKMPDTLKEGKVEVWTIDQCIEFANKVIELCDAIDEYQRKGHMDKLNDAQDKLQSASDKLGKKEASFKKDEDAGGTSAGDTKAMMRAAFNYNTAYNNWIVYPHTPAIKSLMASMRACLSVANKSLSLYK